jgi:hypothetical protein
MEHYVGIDVSLERSSVCVVDATGKIVREASSVPGRQAADSLRMSSRGGRPGPGLPGRAARGRRPCLNGREPFEAAATSPSG